MAASLGSRAATLIGSAYRVRPQLPGEDSPIRRSSRRTASMLKLARWSTTHRKYVLLGWVVLLLGVNLLAQSTGTKYSNNFTLPHSDAQRASDLLKRSFPAQAGDRDTI